MSALFFAKAAFDERLVSVGYPGLNNESTVYLGSNCAMGVFANCECKEGAYTFIEYYLQKPRDKFREGLFCDHLGSIWSLKSIRNEGYELAKNVQVEYSEYPGKKICATDEDIEMVDELIGKAVLLGNDYFTIIRIVYEEYATVENGTATVEQACKVIQSRVSIMLAETE